MSGERAEWIKFLKLTLHGHLVGYLAGYQNGRNILTFSAEFKQNPSRPSLSLITRPNFPNSEALLSTPWVKNQKLHPLLSNLLPEGSLRSLIAQGLKTHSDNEFEILSYLGQDLPGALIATAMQPEEVPSHIMSAHGPVKAVAFYIEANANKFSLAGVQMKFSMKRREGRYNLAQSGDLGDWIIKTPSTVHKNVPENEYTSMKLAELAGIDIPEVKLVELDKLDNLPPINLPNETLAFAIKRFDRENNQRIHMEDFAQILLKYPPQKYNSANYEQLGKVIYQFSDNGLADAQQFARRLLVNILLANGDAHLKNWSVIYQDQMNPRLSPAYDIVTTSVYIKNETKFALNLAKNKAWFEVTMDHFETWANNIGVPWRAVKPHLLDTLEKARSHWPEALLAMPMREEHKEALREHWSLLQPDFKISS